MVVKGGVKGGLVVQRESSEKKFKGEKSYFFFQWIWRAGWKLGVDDGQRRSLEGKTGDGADHVHLTVLVQAGCNKDFHLRNE